MSTTVHPDVPPSWIDCHLKYRQNTRDFILKQIVQPMVDQRTARGLPPADTAYNMEEYEDLLMSDDREWLVEWDDSR
jgi:hypothetical protein